MRIAIRSVERPVVLLTAVLCTGVLLAACGDGADHSSDTAGEAGTAAPDAVASPVLSPDVERAVLVLVHDLTLAEITPDRIPSLADLAERGRVFTEHRIDPSKLGTRYALLHGTYGSRVGLGSDLDPDDVDSTGLASSELGLAEVLRARGFDTAFFGPWDLSGRADGDPLDAARVHGFSRWGAGCAFGRALEEDLEDGDWTRIDDGRAKSSGASPPLAAARSFAAWAEDASDAPSFACVALHLGEPLAVDRRTGSETDRRHRAHAQLDQALGEILAAIDLECTLLVVTSDGPYLDAREAAALDTPALRAATRGVLVVAGPGVIAGRSTAPTHAVDLAATLVTLAGPAPAPIGFLDGVSLAGHLVDAGSARGPVLSAHFGPQGPRSEGAFRCTVDADGREWIEHAGSTLHVPAGGDANAPAAATETVPVGQEREFGALRRFAESIAR